MQRGKCANNNPVDARSSPLPAEISRPTTNHFRGFEVHGQIVAEHDPVHLACRFTRDQFLHHIAADGLRLTLASGTPASAPGSHADEAVVPLDPTSGFLLPGLSRII